MMIDDGDDHDDWWWWSLWSRWLLTTFFFHRKTASWPPSPGGFWPTMFFPLVIFAQPSLFVSFFPVDVKVGWFFFHIALKWYLHSLFPYLRRIASEDIKKVFTQGPYGVRQAYWVCRSWQRVEVPIILRLPMMSKMIKVVAMLLLRLRMTVRMAMIMPIILRLRFYYRDGEDRWRVYWD